MKLLFDIYHQQITEGNLIANIRDGIDLIGHFHVADNPAATSRAPARSPIATFSRRLKPRATRATSVWSTPSPIRPRRSRTPRSCQELGHPARLRGQTRLPQAETRIKVLCRLPVSGHSGRGLNGECRIRSWECDLMGRAAFYNGKGQIRLEEAPARVP